MSTPLGWSAKENGPDISVHLHAARTVLGILTAIDGMDLIDSFPQGAVCALTIMIDTELQAVTDTLEQGSAS